jgi:hypothetical protein
MLILATLHLVLSMNICYVDIVAFARSRAVEEVICQNMFLKEVLDDMLLYRKSRGACTY